MEWKAELHGLPPRIYSAYFCPQYSVALCSHSPIEVKSFEGGPEGTFSKVPSGASPAHPRRFTKILLAFFTQEGENVV